MNRLSFRKILYLIIFAVFSSPFLISQSDLLDRAEAEKEFRDGLKSYHGGYFNRAILSFERSYSFYPDNPHTLIWLGEAYFRTGLVDKALELWEEVTSSTGLYPLLSARIETIRYRRGSAVDFIRQERYVSFSTVEGIQTDYSLFKRPSSVTALPDGDFYMAAYGTNEVIRFGTNGGLRYRIRGGVEILDHPFDVLYDDDSILVSEFEGDRISRYTLDGYLMNRFGHENVGGANLLGPQYLAVDSEKNVYVSDYGHRRVVKFSPDGDFLLDFGRPYLKEPTGILVYMGGVYVADKREKKIYVFDESGNFFNAVGENLFNAPEGLSLSLDGQILVADSDRILSFDPFSETTQTIALWEDGSNKITKAVFDANRNILAADFEQERLEFLSSASSMPAGLDIRVNQIISSEFPKVILDVSVSSREGDPVVGLDNSNFILTEEQYDVSNPSLRYNVNSEDILDLVYILEHSPETDPWKTELKNGIRQIAENHTAGRFGFVHSGTDPFLAREIEKEGLDLTEALNSDQGESLDTPFWRLDESIRMAGTQLLNANGRRAIVLVGSGENSEDPFRNYELQEVLEFLENNEIRLFVVHSGAVMSPELQFLVDETGGQGIPLFQPEGLTGVIDMIQATRSGRYILQYTSLQDSEFGNRYIPVEVRVNHHKKSGRGESGYYAPLVF